MSFQVNSRHTIYNHGQVSRVFTLQDSIEARFLSQSLEDIPGSILCSRYRRLSGPKSATRATLLWNRDWKPDDAHHNSDARMTRQKNRRKCRVLMGGRTNAVHIEDTAPEPTLYVRMLAVGKIILSRSEEVGYSNDSVLGEVSYSIVNGCHKVWDHCTRTQKITLRSKLLQKQYNN